ncbi:MAG: phosphorylase [Flavobacteriales bacterium CG18_big_fil_WC_8_21_14_2_50_32_9]|nr:MAG: phosphorylase [Flavobacteriales bacterium CG18_big_fil_WC_8_21_14_2_50_32_9]PIZ05598.1 MAG: phosphorylase [Flavobacteriales bacterium CG_4_10_14_0_8_um_filter_32_5]PJC62944.1 MAG: phosphorylase [Flavobacteriales bacterium CG_4_9_14_0_2_um_filter_32_27]
MNKIEASELVLNPDNSVYHLKLHPEQLAKNIIVVGDPGRVALISSFFDSIEHKVENREIVTHTGILNGQPITVLSTGMGTDNIDIVLNELDALVNIDLINRTIKPKKTSLNIVRIGTSGALQKDISVNSIVVSEFGLGLDGLMNYYAFEQTEEEKQLLIQFCKQTNYSTTFAKPYFVKASSFLFNLLKEDAISGITATASGFYGPQGRVLRLPLKEDKLNEKLNQFSYNNHKIVNFEMETSALYGLSRALGHNACTVCVVVANRFSKEFSKDYKPAMDQLIQKVLLKLTQNRS